MYNFHTLRHIEGLDGVRLIAVSLVLFGHFGIPKVPGGLGVTVFFFLSGFLITTLLFQEHAANGKVAIGNFYIRRLLRLGPELMGLVVLATILGFGLGRPPHFWDLLSAVTYLSNYYGALLNMGFFAYDQPYWSHLWSLAVEEHYYLTYPLLFSWMIFSRSRAVWFFSAVLLGCLAWRTYLVVENVFPLTWTNPYTYMASEARIDSIAYGAVLAFLAQRDGRLSTGVGRLCVAIGLGLMLFTLVIRDDLFRETIRYSLQGVAMMLIFAHLYLTRERSFLMPLLENPLMRWGGLLSYGAYLWHGEVIRVYEHFGLDLRAAGPAARAIGIPAGIALTFLIAFASYQLLARPALRLRRKFGSHSV